MIDLVSDPSKAITYYFRVNRNATPLTLPVVDEFGDPFPVNTKVWQVNFKRSKNDTTNVLQLTDGDGIALGVSSIVLQPDADQTNIQVRDYYIEIYNVTDETTHFSGTAKAHNGEFDNFSSEYGTGVVINTIAPSVYQISSTPTLAPDISLYDSFEITAQAEPLVIANPTGTIGNFEGFVHRVTDDGTSQAISYGNKYRAFGSALPTATTIGKTIYLICIYNSTDDVYDTASREEV